LAFIGTLPDPLAERLETQKKLGEANGQSASLQGQTPRIKCEANHRNHLRDTVAFLDCIGDKKGGGFVSIHLSRRGVRRFPWAAARVSLVTFPISFKAPSDFELPTAVIRRLAAELGRALNASLIGDEGEIYE
jgi:hypothetical protein